MSALEEAIFTRATTGPTLQPLIGTRCYPVLLPQNPTYPAVTFQRISTPREHAMVADPGVAHPRFQLTAYDKTRALAQTLAEAIRKDFARWRGTVAGVVIQDTFVENAFDLPRDDLLEVHPVPVDLVVHHVET